jgi:hypothetical protein
MTKPLTTEARKDSIRAAAEAAVQAVAAGQGAATNVRWKDSELVLPVAQVDLTVVLLNPHSHRISAQLQSLPDDRQDLVRRDPYTPEAQEIIAMLLRATPGFERIKKALENDGQLEPGVITTSGVLVNANTRVAALRDLRRHYVKVTVLPADATTKEITDLELRLQMEQEVKQDYSFTSQLLFIEDLINSSSYTTQEVGLALQPDLGSSKADTKKAVDLVEKELRLLGLIREVRDASGGALSFLWFDDKRQALIEIDQDYQKLKVGKPEEATRVREAQLAGLISGVDYRKLRQIDRELLDNYLGEALRENGTLGPHLEQLLSGPDGSSEVPDGLDLLDDDNMATTTGSTSLTGLYELLVKSRDDETFSIPEAGDAAPVELPRRAIAAGVHGALMTAIENKQLDSRKLDELTAPMTHLRDAARAIDRAVIAYADVKDKPSFDHDTFLDIFNEWQRAVSDLLAKTQALEDSQSSD